MQTNEAAIEMINDLIKINNDRIAGYEKAIDEAKEKETDLRPLFEQMIAESNRYKQELMSRATELGDNPVDDDTTTAGAIYRAWMTIKSSFTDDPSTVLDSCEFGEDAWRRAYEGALTAEDIDPDIREMIQAQYNAQEGSHRLIKQKRDEYNAMSK